MSARLTAAQHMPGWAWLACTCGREELVMVNSESGQAGICTRCLSIAKGIMDREGRWLGAYARDREAS